MSDRMAAEIAIGGRIPDSLITDLCTAICEQEVALSHEGALLEPQSAEDLLAACKEDNGLLVLYDLEADDGEFSDLEGFLWTHDIPYTRRSDGIYEHDPRVVEFRPESGLFECLANKALKPVVLVEPLWEVIRELKAALRSIDAENTKTAQDKIETALGLLNENLPLELPPVPRFEIGTA